MTFLFQQEESHVQKLALGLPLNIQEIIIEWNNTIIYLVLKQLKKGSMTDYGKRTHIMFSRGYIYLAWTNSISNIHIQISSPDWSPYILLKNKLRELRKIKEISLKGPCLLILITSFLDYVCILSGENWCWSLL